MSEPTCDAESSASAEGLRPRRNLARTESSAWSASLTAVLALAVGWAACCVIPLRLRFGPDGSPYTFGYIGDEYLYAQHVQPLIAGTTTANILNGLGPTRVVPPLYLELLLRGAVTHLGIDVVSLLWTWRYLMPAFLFISIGLLVRTCLARWRRREVRTLDLALTAATGSALYLVYDLLVPFPPWGGCLNRFPSAIEFPLSIAIVMLWIGLLRRPTGRGLMALAALGAATVYLRPYAAVGWGLATSLSVLELGWRKRLASRDLLKGVGVFALLMTPWVIVEVWNTGLPEYRETVVRFTHGASWRNYPLVHSAWGRYIGFALGLLFVSFRAAEWWRGIAVWSGLVLVVLTFTCRFLPMASQFMDFDRLSCFYLVAALAALLLLCGDCLACGRGRALQMAVRRWALRLGVFAVFAGVVLAWRNSVGDFSRYPFGPYRHIVAEQRMLPGYKWLRENTPPGTLCLVDDGLPWSEAAGNDPATIQKLLLENTTLADLFQLVAQRRRVASFALLMEFIPKALVRQLGALQLGTLGYPECDDATYLHLLDKIRPGYVFWRRTHPFPLAQGVLLLPLRTIVYRDEFCEIWRLDYAPGEPSAERRETRESRAPL
ncbi:MAG TPA: hypothetical protein VGP72_11680 [Planctomycetota bacterium]|jgi:hypothetical protein